MVACSGSPVHAAVLAHSIVIFWGIRFMVGKTRLLDIQGK